MIDHQLDFVPFLRLLDQLILVEDGEDSPLRFEAIVTQETRVAEALDECRVHGLHGRITAPFPGSPGHLALSIHRLIKTRHVKCQPLVLDDFLSEVEWKAIGIVELKDFLARDDGLAALPSVVSHLRQHLQARFERFTKALFLVQGDIGRKDARGVELGIGVSHDVRNRPQHLVQKRLREAQHFPVARRSAYNAPQHVAAPVIGRHHSVAEQEAGGPGMISDHAHGYIVGWHDAVALATQCLDSGDERAEEIGVIVTQHPLHDGSDTLKAHAGVDARPRQWRELTLPIALELHEHEVPDFHVAIAVAANRTILSTA